MIDIHIGLDLSFNSTGITIYTEKYENTKEKIQRNIEFHRLVRDKEITSIMLNLNQHMYYSQLLSIDLDLKHDIIDNYQNAINYSNDQIDLTEKYYISVKSIMNIILKFLKELKLSENIHNENINMYLNMEGSILTGYNFNTQIGVNMLQGFLRAELIKIQLINNFKTFKFRMVPPTLLKSFFTNNGNADKKEMVESFINNYDGRKLLPQIDNSTKKVDIFNDVIDSFALVAFNVYDLKMEDKYLFSYVKPPKIKTKTKKVRRKKSVQLNDLIDDKVLTEFSANNIQSNILLNNNII